MRTSIFPEGTSQFSDQHSDADVSIMKVNENKSNPQVLIHIFLHDLALTVCMLATENNCLTKKNPLYTYSHRFIILAEKNFFATLLLLTLRVSVVSMCYATKPLLSSSVPNL